MDSIIDTIKVRLKENSYDIIVEESLSAFYKFIENIASKKIFIVSDSKVAKLYLPNIEKNLSVNHEKEVSSFVFKKGEKNKTLETVKEAYEVALKSGIDRNSCLVSLGGGVTGDIAGFIASTFMRGIIFVQIPTSLLSMVDASVGGKTGVDFLGYKNIIGTFYQPKAVFIDIDFLKTLPKNEFRNGLAEVIKYAIINGNNFLSFLEENSQKIIKNKKSVLINIIKKCCETKADIVSKDEKETKLREILNLGHTFGHAMEKLSDFRYSHGEAVAIGMCMAASLSYRLGKINQTELDRIRNIIKIFSLPTKCADIKCKDIYNEMKKDKKSKDGTIHFTLINSIGEVIVKQEADEAIVRKAIKDNSIKNIL